MEYRSKPPKTKVTLSNEGKANVNKDVSWSYDLVFACFPLSFFLFPFLLSCLSCDGFCRIPFRLRFLSTFPIFSSPAAFTFLSSFCFSSVISFRLQIEFFIILFCIFIRRLRFSVWFCVLERSQNEGKNEGKIHDKQLGMDLARSWQAFFPILLLLRQLLPPPRCLVMLLLQAFVLPPPAKHQHHHHHCDDCW